MRPSHHGPPPSGSRSNPGQPSPAETGLEALEWAVSSGTAAEVVRRAVAGRRRRRARRLTAGAVALALTAVVAWFPSREGHASRAPDAVPVSAVVIAPERRTLPDGSVVEMRSGADIVVEYFPTVRRVVLLSGEAHFQVYPDSSRPFVVDAAGVEVRAVGTAFAVNRARQGIDVIVTEGRVAVAAVAAAAARGPGSAPTLVSAGEQFGLSLNAVVTEAVRPFTPAERRDRLGWRIPLLELGGTPLAEVVGLVGRYGNHMLLLDPALGDLRVSGTLRADDLESLLTLLRTEFGISASPVAGSDLIGLRR